MRFSHIVFCAIHTVLLASAAYAQDSALAPMPNQERISANDDSAILTTHTPTNATHAASDANVPWKNETPMVAPAPAPVSSIAPLTAPVPLPAQAPKASPFGASPFGRGEAPAPLIPSGPHETIAVPVVRVDSVEPAEAAPPTPVSPQADPSKEDPANPTELTSPIFGDSDTSTGPRKIVLRLLNKVTAQSQLLTFKPNETIKVGTLEITAITCQISAPQSQTDYAGLIDIIERVATAKEPKPLFRGWMYASSPSITALEHPVYDVTMVACETLQAPKKDGDDKPARKGKK